MTEPVLHSSGVELLDADRLRLVETVAPRVPAAERPAMDRVWEEAVRANPSLFDGPVAACVGLDREGPRGLVLTWARATYRRYALRRVPGATSWLPSLFAGVVQPTDDGRLLVGRSSPVTAAPGRWQLPGGSVEPPDAHGPLDEAWLRRHAAREMVEETGVDAPPGDLARWLLTRGANGSVGVFFLAPPRPVSLLRERYAGLVSAERAAGRDPELDRLAFVGSADESAVLDAPGVPYLQPLVRRYFGEPPGASAAVPAQQQCP